MLSMGMRAVVGTSVAGAEVLALVVGLFKELAVSVLVAAPVVELNTASVDLMPSPEGVSLPVNFDPFSSCEVPPFKSVSLLV